MANPTEKRELDLVDKVDFRILGVSNNEEKLQQLLKTYLSPLLLKAGSEHASVRSKVIEICQRLNVFIKPPGIVLPVAALLDQYKTVTSPLVKHFDLVFVQHSVGRLGLAERRQLIPKVVRGIGSDLGSGTAGVFNVFLRLLPDLRIPPRGSKEDATFREDCGLGDERDGRFVAEYLGKVFLLRTGAGGSVRPETPSPGLTDSDVAFLTLSKPETWSGESGGLRLPEIRIRAVQLLASAAFSDEDRFVPALYASAHSDSRVSTVGEDLLKRSTVSLEDKGRVASLFEAHRKLPTPYKIRILGLLSRSEAASAFGEQIVEVCRDNMVRSDGRSASGGLEANKTQKALFEFITWIARVGSRSDGFSETGQQLIELLQEFIFQQGWPKPEKERQSIGDAARRSQAYETIGTLAKGVKLSTTVALSLLGWLFRSLAEDPQADAVVNIDGALSGFTAAFVLPLTELVRSSLTTILLTYMTMEVGGDVVRSARHAAAKWANTVLAPSDVYARWIDILAVAGRRDERNEVVEEGRKGLDPWTYRANHDKGAVMLPRWDVLVHKIFCEHISHLNASVWLSGSGSGMDVDGASLFVNFSSDAIHAFPVAVDYCRRVLFLTALGNDFKLEPGWERQLEALAQSDKKTRETIRSYLASADGHPDELRCLLAAALEGMMRDNASVVEQCAGTFVELASFAPAAALQGLASRSRELLPLVKSNRREIRPLGAKAYGILAAHPANSAEAIAQSSEALASTVSALDGASGSELNAVEGAFVALAHLRSRLVYYSTQSVRDASDGLAKIYPTLERAASATSLSTQEALFESFTQLWTAGIPALAAPDGVNPTTYLEEGFVAPLVVQAKKGNEKAIAALGRLALVWDDNDVVGSILTQLYALHELRQAEVHFAVGEAIAAAVARWDADAVLLTLDVEPGGDTSYRVGRRSDRVAAVLDKLLADSKTTKPSLLKATGIWLFCLIQHGSHLDEVQRRLRACQTAFMRLLSARDELVQETASRGLALVYDKGDAGLKGELVRDLVASFTGAGPQLKVDDDTELFEAGALPTGDGKSVTSYRDIVSLANEVGDQSLVYKFMSLANSAAAWSTRSAFGRFGLSSILSESEVDPKLYPKLYRYRFDPNPNVQRSMDDIWKALVRDSRAVIDAHFDAIMRDLLASILGREWRVRQASCAAISDLMQGQPFARYEPYYRDVWTSALRVLDDVKATVREAALRLCIGLSNTLVRQLEESHSPAAAAAMMREALPFLLSDRGIESGVEDVKAFSTVTVLKIAKHGGRALKPYVATVVPHLLGLLSTVEPDAVNYHYLRAGEDRRDRIDKLRAAMVSQSPISEAVEDCLRHVDADVMAALVPALEAAVKSAVGMPTKIGCGRVLGTLATRHADDFRPFSARFLELLARHALDRNDEVSQGYARAAAYVVRVAPDDARLRFAEGFVDLYLGSEDESRRQKVADAVLALAKISPDHFGALEGVLLPFAFLAKHDTDEYVRTACAEVWDKHAGSSSLTVARYVPEIVALVRRSLDTAQWALRHGGALTTASLVGAVAGDGLHLGSQQASPSTLEAVWPVFDRSLALKTFAGKEKLLDVFPDFVARGKALWEGNKEFAAQLEKIAAREAKRNNDAYRPHAFRCLRRFAAAREDLDMLGTIYGVAGSYINTQEKTDDEAMDVDQPRSAAGVDLRGETVWAAVEAVAKGYNRKKMRDDPVGELGRIVATLEGRDDALPPADPILAKGRFDDLRRIFWYGCVVDLMDEGAAGSLEASKSSLPPLLAWFLATLDLDVADRGTEDQRLTRAKAVGAVVKLWKKRPGMAEEEKGLREKLEKAIGDALGAERSMEVKERWKSCLALLQA